MRQYSAPLVDLPLLSGLSMLCALSMVALYSAGGEDVGLLVKQGLRITVAFALMLLVARISPAALARWSPYLYGLGLLLLLAVLAVGITGKGAQRWLDLGLVRFQPAEIMKIAAPMMVAWLLSRRPLPPSLLMTALATLAVLLPVMLVMAQPDLGTALLIAASGIMVIFLAGIRWKWILAVLAVAGAVTPVLWTLILHDYQRRRILTLFDPSADPLGAGYHTIQSMIAVGAGGLKGKGWLAGTQSRLEFIPERGTDFIFAVYAEEFGFIGAVLMLGIYLFLGGRGLLISFHAHDTYSRLLGACLSIAFFFHVFVNMGMTIGILPVVGAPLPLVSYGGTSMATLMIMFGILMGIRRQKTMLSLKQPL